MNHIGQQMANDHRELEALLKRLADDALAPECGALQCTWSELESRLLAHMAAEEHYLLPLIEASHPAEVARTFLEHKQIRHQVSELGLAIELHTARNPAIEELIRTLQAHAQYEDQTLYTLAGDKASMTLQHRISAMLKTAVHLAKLASDKLEPGRAHGDAEPGHVRQ
jgi:hypothetical protein